MTETNLLIKYSLYFSFFEENGKRIVKCFLSSKNQSGIRRSSFFLVKFLIVFSITCFGYPAPVYLLLILFVSSSKSEAILLVLCSSPVITFPLYLKGTFEGQCTGSFFALFWTCVLIPWSGKIISASRNLFGLVYNVSLNVLMV